MKALEKKTVLSGIQPSNSLHLGNYLGAIKNWVALQEHYDCYFLMVDLHAITVSQDPKHLRESSYLGIAAYLAAGISQENVSLFLQSHISAHAELAWALSCFSYMGELSRMTQFKDKSQKQATNIGVGLFTYPVLMAADILLYQPHFVPVGDDQKQHIELTRNLAERINHRYNQDLFIVPAPLIGQKGEGARVMDLQNPQLKMSKSAENPKGTIFLNDSDKQIIQKIKSAITDSGSEVMTYEKSSSGVQNLIDIYAAVTDQEHAEVAQRFSGKMYGHLKVATAEAVVETLAPIRDRMQRFMADKAYLDSLLKKGAEKAREKAQSTLARVYDVMGFVPRH